MIDAVTSQPLGGIPVFGREKIPQDKLDERNTHPYQMWRTDTQTNEQGEFELPISETAWSVMIDGPVYGFELDDPTSQNPNQFFDVLAGNEPSPLYTFKLTPKKRIRGVVIGGDGTPRPNAMVVCSYLTSDLIETIATTNAMGEFEMPPHQVLYIRRMFCLTTMGIASGFAVQFNLSNRTFGDDLVGLVRDSARNPVSTAIVRVFASRPIDSSPTVVTILHPDCELTAESDGQGRFELKGISNGQPPRLIVRVF